MSPTRAITIGLAVLTGMAGCQHDNQGPQPIQPVFPNQSYGYPIQPSGQPFMGSPGASGQPIPSGGDIGGGEMLLPEPLPGAAPSPPAFNGSERRPPSSQSAYPNPARLTVRLGTPQPPEPTHRPVVRLLAPIERPSPDLMDKPASESVSAPESAPVEPSDLSVIRPIPDQVSPEHEDQTDLFQGSLFPLGIANFSVVFDSLACGLRPDLDGLEWLRQNRYRSLLHVHHPNTESNADRRLIERKQFAYHEITIDPSRFEMRSVEDFNRLVNDPKPRPMFVYDRDGALLGPLWYAHFRTVAQLSHNEARERTLRLGFNLDATDSRLLMIAIRDQLGDPAP